MTDPAASERILVAAPLGRDASLMIDVLMEAGYQAEACASAAELIAEIERGAGMALVTYEFLDDAALDALGASLHRQPPWSDFPLLFFTPGDQDPAAAMAAERLQSLGNVGLLERPIRLVTLLSAVASSLRSRRRQYEMRALLSALQDGVLQRDKFLAMLGHELRNPLAAIVTAVEVMELTAARDAEADTGVRQRGVIRRQSRVLARLVDDLLDVARVTTGKIRLQLERVELPGLVRRAVDAERALAERQGVALRCRLDEGAGLATVADVTRLEQVLLNLLNNAVKYTPAGGAVDVTLSAVEGRAEITVRDTGIGIEPDVLPRIFDLFRQADGALHRSGGGLGLGLTLSRSLVELHGGSMAAASEGLGKGSTFSLRLPLAPAAASSPSAGTASPGTVAGKANGLRVFVVEDREDNRDGMVALLETLGCAVDSAADGQSGANRIVEVQPDAAIVDIGLPAIDGYEVARRVRRALGNHIVLAAVRALLDRTRARVAG